MRKLNLRYTLTVAKSNERLLMYCALEFDWWNFVTLWILNTIQLVVCLRCFYYSQNNWLSLKVNGCVVSIRPKMNKISIWTSATDCVVEVDEALADLLGRRGVFLIHNSWEGALNYFQCTVHVYRKKIILFLLAHYFIHELKPKLLFSISFTKGMTLYSLPSQFLGSW